MTDFQKELILMSVCFAFFFVCSGCAVIALGGIAGTIAGMILEV